MSHPGSPLRRTWPLLVAFTLLLLGAVLAQLAGSRQRQPEAMPPLVNRLPSALPGWRVRDLPVADSPEVRRATEATLRYDDVLFREYRKGDQLLQVYVSLWQPGKIDAREVAIHNPDNCWTANGFTLLEAASKPVERLADVRVAPGQFRQFKSPAGSLEVEYWLMVDGKPFGIVDQATYTKALATRVTAFFRTVWFGLVSGGHRKPIYFVRISGPRQLEHLLAEPELRPLVGALGAFLPVEAVVP